MPSSIVGLEYKDFGAPTAVLEYKMSAPAAVEAHQVGTGDTAEGIVDAYVAVTGVRDEVGDIIEPGFFEESLRQLRPKMCLGHDWNRPIGEPEEIEELHPGDPRLPAHDHEGNPWPREAGALWTRSRYMLGTQDGRDAYEHAKFYGPRTAYSIGYVPDKETLRFKVDGQGRRTRHLFKGMLYEYGPVLHGANALARQAAIKSGQPQNYEGKVRLVRNMDYWGLPVGTPIRPGMKPRGPVARKLERAGKVADENRGVVEIDANNPQSLRLKPTAKGKAKRNDGLYISDLMTLFQEGTVDPESNEFVISDTSNLPDRQRVNRGDLYDPLDMLIANAVTPAELEDDLRNGADWAATQERLGQVEEIQPQVDAFIDDVLDVYREKYNAALVEQHGAGQVDDIAEAEDQGDQDVADAVTGDKPTKPKRSTTSLTTLSPQELAAAVAEMDDAELEAHERELTARAESLGKPGERNRAHEAIAAERERRADDQTSTQVPTETPPADEPGPEAGVPELPSPLAQEIYDAIQAAPPSKHFGNRIVDAALPGNAGIAMRAVGTMFAGRKKRIDPIKGGQRSGKQHDAAKAAELADAYEAVADAADAMGLGNENDRGDGFGGISEYLRNFATGIRSVHGIEQQGTPERTENTPDNEIEDVSAGEQPSVVDGEMDVAEDIPATEEPEAEIEATQETSEFEPGAVLGDDGRPVPRVPVNDAGDFYDDHGDIVSGSSEYDQALNQATDAINDGDENALADALAPFVGMVDSNTGGFGPAEEAARLIELIPRDAIAEVQQWTQQANERGNADFTADRSATTSAFVIADDDYLVTEAARMRGILIERSAAGDPPTDGFVREAAMRLRLIQAEQTRREQGENTEDPAEPVTPQDSAVLAAEELADAQDIADASYGIYEAEDGEFEADPDIADRQDRVADLLTQAEAGSLDLSAYDDDGLHTTRADVLSELRLQNHLETRRRQDLARTRSEREQENVTSAAGEVTPPEGAKTEDADLTEPEGPRPRPGVAGAAEDLADALDDGDEGRITTTRARLEASLRRSRSTSEHVTALRTVVESGGELDPAQLRALAEAIRVETRAKRNASARDRRRVRRFERERLRSLLGDVETAMSARRLAFDAAPEDMEIDDGIVVGVPGAGVWSTRSDQIDWLGYAVTVREVSGTNYRASVSTKPDGRSTYEWEIRGSGEAVLTGGGDTATPEDAVGMVELILHTQRTRGALPADAALPQTRPRSTSSALSGEVVAARSAAIAERLASGSMNPLTGLPDPLRDRPRLIPPPVAAFDKPLDVREYLLTQVARETDDNKRDRLANSIAQIRWDDVTLSPGGGLAVVSMAGQRGHHILHTRSGQRADILINGTSSANLPKADQVRIMAIMESVPNASGRVVDFNQDRDDVRAAFDDFGSIAGPDSHSNTVGAVFMGEKLRAGNLPAGLLKTVPIGVDNVGWNNRANPVRYDAVKEKTTALGYLITDNSKANKQTRATIRHGWALANAGAPDATAALYRRRAEELREEFGAKAGDRGAILLDEIADNLLAMWAPEQSQGERARSLKAGERLTVTENEEVRNYRLLTDMRSTSDYARQSEAQVIDEATGATYRLGIWSDFSRRDSLALWPNTKGGNHIWNLPLSSDEFVVTDGEETAPDTADAVRARARADIQSVPQSVLDAAANLLAENRTEAEERRATGARSRTDARAPRRTAATPPEEPQPVPGEQHLAAAQGRLLPAWIGADYSESDAPAAGGFTSEQEWRDFIAGEIDRLANMGSREGDGLKVIGNPNYEKVTLSPGGNFVITSNHYVVHARSLQAVWGMGNTHWNLTGGAKPTAASSMAVATHLERAQLNGRSVDWTKGADQIGEEVQEFVKANGNIVAPAARAAFQRMLATGKTLRVSDIDAFVEMTRRLDPVSAQGNTVFQVPNPATLAKVQRFSSATGANPYNQAGNARTVGGDRTAVATTKAGQTLAKKIDFEMRLASAMSKVAPLDAARRLMAIADAVDGQTIETIDHRTSQAGDTLDPAKDLRALAKAITDAYDEKQISPAGMLLRNNFTGVIRPTGTVKPQASAAPKQHVTDERYSDTDFSEIRVWRDKDGVKHTTFGDLHLIDRPADGAQIRRLAGPGQVAEGRMQVNFDGSFELSWSDVSGIFTVLKFDDWEYEPPADVVPDGDSAPTQTGEPDREDRTEPDSVTSEDEGASIPDSAAQGDLNRAVEQTNREREGLRELNAGELRERLDDARRRAATDASVQEEIRILRRELDARESAERDVAKAPR